MVSSVCGGIQVMSTKTSVSDQQSIMVVGVSCLGLHECCRHWGATVHWGNHECQHVLWHTEAEYDPLPSETGPQGSIQHDNDHCLAKEAEGKGDGLAKHVSRPNPIEHLWGILKQKVEERKVSKIHQLMSSWRSGRGLQWQHVKLWWTQCPRGLKQCWKITVATKNIDTLGLIWTFSLRGVLTFVASGLDINGCVWSYFEGTTNLHYYTSCTLTTLHCSKV